ncbi:hypothetical protein N184_36310 [Sinorhizobium sp. GL28]|nr:hypothetical protein N184_36310 [Sinorhizobium sp. GL28]
MSGNRLRPHEGLNLFGKNLAVPVGIHSVEDPLLNCGHFFKRDSTVFPSIWEAKE